MLIPMKKLNQFLQSIYLLLFKSSKKFKQKDKLFNICDKMQTAKDVLLCFPSEPNAASFALSTARELQATFQSWHITVCVAETANAPGLRNATIILLTEKDVSFYGLPKKAFSKNLFQSRFDIVIDLGLDYGFTNLALVINSEADLQIGYFALEREDFYNFLLRQKMNASPEQAGQMLVNTLKSL